MPRSGSGSSRLIVGGTIRSWSAITDAMGNLSVALNVSAAMLALGAVLAAFQRKLVKEGE